MNIDCQNQAEEMCGHHLMESNLVLELDWVEQIVCFETNPEPDGNKYSTRCERRLANNI